MGFNFRKSIKIANGVKLNIGKKSAGVSVGGKYAGVSFNTRSGARVRASVPGTGVSYTKSLKNSSKGSGTKKRTGSTILMIVTIVIAILFVLYNNWDTVSEFFQTATAAFS